ncbi:NAD-dependent epimerase/dehydratase family protein [Nocardioides sp. TF02-7]|uniref:NAD-dependent epimerase/dehydratase family protein n=1 Tax=Nocardioides sp. TF02-7 TaxID=2917724 RepID=UPI001F06444B|nr:NAD-dependent epimerase/dehydratase family protein [Nocardioides sp. TF02-7]UMG93245.1 NAD-dependent epimerase/dehydratase family protein [Nocardioides sp. TF02-7]
MRYAMTGATGFLGGELARQLRSSGHDVVALVRDPAKAGPLQADGVRLVEGDLGNADALDRLLEGADGFFHVAGWYRHGRREHAALRRANVEGTREALEAARRARVRTVYTSTIAINSDTRGQVPDETYEHAGPWAAEYDRTKWEAHRLAREYAAAGLPLVVVQPSVVYGPGDTGSTLGQLVRQVVAGRTVLGPRGGGACWAHVADVARGHVLAMELGRTGESYFLSGERATYDEVLALVKEVAGSRSRVVLLPRPLVRANALLTAPLERVVRLPQTLTADAARAGCATYYGDAAKARAELGWSSRPWREGMAATVRAELGLVHGGNP